MLLQPSPLVCNLYERTLTSSVGAFIMDLAPRLTAYTHSISATFGFESAELRLNATLEEAQAFTGRLLCPLIVYGADADVAWEGYLAGVAFSAGGEQVSVSLDAMSNRVRVRYTLRGLGTPQVTAATTSATSTAIYGTRDLVLSAGAPTDSTAATALRDAALAARALPRPQATGTAEALAGGSGGGPVEVTLTFAGWYSTLDWVLFERTDTSTESTTTQVGALIGTGSPGIGATNPFLSTSTARITASGVSDTRQAAADTSYRQKIEALLAKGNSSGQRLCWGVYEGRVFVVEAWAGATPSTIGYRRRLGSALIEDGHGAIVPPWMVRPNAMREVVDLLDPAPTTGAVDTAARSFVERVTFSIDSGGYRVGFEPAASDGVDARVARLGG